MRYIYLTVVALLVSFSSFAIGPITGLSNLCAGTTIFLTDTTAGGTWTSSASGIAAVDMLTGVVTGGSPGAATITYTVGASYVTFPISISRIPISQNTNVCNGSSTTLHTIYSYGGVWTSSNSLIAQVGSTSGVLTGMSLGTAIVTFTGTGGCIAFDTVSVVNTLSSITGPSFACTGDNLAFSEATEGGTWTSNNTAVATIYYGFGTVGYGGGISAGSAIMSYTTGACGTAVYAVSVLASPGPILGAGSSYGLILCEGSTATLTDSTPGGVWSSDDTTLAKISPSGILQGIRTGHPIISYTTGNGCRATRTTCLVPNDAHIYSLSQLCLGDSMKMYGFYSWSPSYADSIGSWSSGNSSVVTVASSGIATGISAGTATISFYARFGCVTDTIIRVVNSGGIPPPARPPNMCSGEVIGMFDSVGGGTWTSSNTAIATVNSFLGSLTSIAAGTSIITYSTGLCGTATTTVTVRNRLDSQYVIEPLDTFCNGPDYYIKTCGVSPSFNVTTYYGDGTYGNMHLTTTFPGQADVFHAYNAPGTYSVKQVLYDGTVPFDSVTFSHTYNYCRMLPIMLYFDGNSNCINDSGDLPMFLPCLIAIDSNGMPIDTISSMAGFYYRAYGAPGTVYRFKVISSRPGLHLTCPSSGIVYDTIQPFTTVYPSKYIGFTSATGTVFDLQENVTQTCGRHLATGTIVANNNYSAPQTAVVTLNFSPKYYSITASPSPSSVSGNTATWILPNLSSGLPPTTINYTLHIYNEWVFPYVWLTPGDTANTTVNIGPIFGDLDTTNNHCHRVDTIKSSYDPNEMQVSPEGKVLPCTPLQYTIRFENTGNDTAHNIHIMDTLSDNVDIHSMRIISATSAMNIALLKAGGRNVVKFDFPGINLLDSSHHNQCDGLVMYTIKARPGLADGITIPNRAGIYFDDNPVVMTNAVQNVIGMNPVIGPDTVFVGGQIGLYDNTPGGTWHSSSTAKATVSSSGMVTGVSTGTTIISYTASTSCTTRTVTKAVSVLSLPNAGSITGPTTVCANATIALTDTTAGGLWSSSNTSVAMVGSTGIVTGVSAGMAVISYSVSNSGGTAAATTTITVNPSPNIYTVSGGGTYCASDTVKIGLSNSQAGFGYELYKNNSPVMNRTGNDSALVFMPVSNSGVYTIIATDSTTMCTSRMTDSAVFIINPLPDTFTVGGGGRYCIGGTGVHVTLNNSKSGINYQLYRDTVAVGTALAGANASLDFGLQTVAGSYKVTAIDPATGCRQVMLNYAFIIINPLPIVYTVTGGGPYCASDGGSDIALSGSQVGVKYNLYYGNSINRTVNGTGSGIDFGLAGGVGTYTVAAVYNGTGCTSNMLGSVSINVNTNPNIYKVTGGGAYWKGDKGVHIGLSGSDVGVNYHLYKGNFFTGIVVPGNDFPLDFGTQSGAGTYTVKAYNNATGCGATMADSAEIITNPQVYVFPNPSRGEVTIKMDRGAYSSFTITNTYGQVVMRQDISNTETDLNVRSFPAGMYYIEFHGSHGNRVQKFVKL
jgi:trimeric autotransporter adhesin